MNFRQHPRPATPQSREVRSDRRSPNLYAPGAKAPFHPGDLLIYLTMLLKEHPDVREKICASYQYLMVDEYQDTNEVQAEISYLIAGQHQNTRNFSKVGLKAVKSTHRRQ